MQLGRRVRSRREAQQRSSLTSPDERLEALRAVTVRWRDLINRIDEELAPERVNGKVLRESSWRSAWDDELASIAAVALDIMVQIDPVEFERVSRAAMPSWGRPETARTGFDGPSDSFEQLGQVWSERAKWRCATRKSWRS